MISSALSRASLSVAAALHSSPACNAVCLFVALCECECVCVCLFVALCECVRTCILCVCMHVSARESCMRLCICPVTEGSDLDPIRAPRQKKCTEPRAPKLTPNVQAHLKPQNNSSGTMT